IQRVDLGNVADWCRCVQALIFWTIQAVNHPFQHSISTRIYNVLVRNFRRIYHIAFMPVPSVSNNWYTCLELSPNPGHMKEPLASLRNQLTWKILGNLDGSFTRLGIDSQWLK